MSKVKRIIAAILVFVTMATFYPSFIIAEEVPDGESNGNEQNQPISTSDASVVASGEDGNIIWSLDSNGVITISGTGEMKGYDPSSMPWRDYKDSIVKVVIDNGVTSIGHDAFLWCSNVTCLEIGSSVTKIDWEAFYGCAGLKDIIIPESVTEIDYDSFAYCSAIEKISVSENNTAYYSESNCLIEKETKMLILGCKNSEIPSDVTGFGGFAFAGCSGLKSITIPSKVSEIGDFTFSGCPELENIVVEDGNTNYISDSNCVITRETNKLVAGCKNSVIPSYVTEIDSYAFARCDGLVNLKIPSGVTGIGYSAFMVCSELINVEIPDGLTTIDSCAFESCVGLKTIYIPSSVITLGGLTFTDCSSDLVIYCGADSKPEGWEDIWNTYSGSSDNLLNVVWGCTREAYEKATDASIVDNGTCGDSVRWKLTDDGTLTISGSGEMYQYDGPSSLPWSDFKTDIVNVIVEDGITNICNFAFVGCSNLENMEFSGSVTSIGIEAFYGCVGLTSLTIPESVTSISSSAFECCSGLSSISVSESNTVYYSASNCIIQRDISKLVVGCKNSVIPSNVKIIDDLAFRGCTELKKITIPSEVTEIGFAAFACCSGLETITVDEKNSKYLSDSNCIITKDTYELVFGCKNSTIPSYVTKIGYCAFEGCTGLTNLIIPASVISVNSGAFRNCTGIETITVSKDNTTYYSESNCVIIEETKELVLGCKNSTVPSNVEGIAYDAFLGCNGLTNIYIPSSVSTISSFAFEECSSNLIIYCGASSKPDGWADGWNLIEGENEATVIWGCTREEYEEATDNSVVESGTCGENVKWVYKNDGTLKIYGTGAMSNYSTSSVAPWYKYRSQITSLKVIEGITSVGAYSFYSLNKLTSASINDSVTSIANGAFQNCAKLTDIFLPENLKSLSRNIFSGCAALNNIDIPEGLTYIGEAAFSGCSKLTDIVIPSGVKNIGGEAFKECSLLTGINIPEGVTAINDLTFYGCSSLTDISIPENVTEIGFMAFADCSSLTGLLIPDGITEIESGTFQGCSSLTDIKIPESISTIGSSAFSLCTSLKKIKLPDGVTALGSAVFSGCSSLTGVEIPEGVTIIKESMFLGCSSMVSISLTNDVIFIEDYAFSQCDNLTTVFYTGTPDKWKSISIGNYNECLKNATINYNHSSVSTAVLEDGGRSLSLVDMICINHYNAITSDTLTVAYIKANGGLLVWNSEISESDATYGNCISDNDGYRVEGLKYYNGKYYQQTQGIIPRNYGNNCYLRIYLCLEDGSYIYGPLKEYSVNTYCNNRIEKSTNEKMITLAKTILSYGAAADDYFTSTGS